MLASDFLQRGSIVSMLEGEVGEGEVGRRRDGERESSPLMMMMMGCVSGHDR